MCDAILPTLSLSERTEKLVGSSQILKNGHGLHNALHFFKSYRNNQQDATV